MYFWKLNLLTTDNFPYLHSLPPLDLDIIWDFAALWSLSTSSAPANLRKKKEKSCLLMGMKSCVTLKAGIEIYGYYLYFQWLKAYLGEYLAHLKELSQEEWLNIDFL